jgi:hypothetical protein
MMYHDAGSRRQLHEDVSRFVRAAIPTTTTTTTKGTTPLRSE